MLHLPERRKPEQLLKYPNVLFSPTNSSYTHILNLVHAKIQLPANLYTETLRNIILEGVMTKPHVHQQLLRSTYSINTLHGNHANISSAPAH